MSVESLRISFEGTTGRPTEPGPGNLVFEGGRADSYVKELSRAVRAARCNAFFPPTTPFCDHVGFLGPLGSQGLHERLHVSRQGGLPVAREIYRVKIDRDLARGFLLEAKGRGAAASDSRLARRIAYHERLVLAEIMPLQRLMVELRKRQPEQSRALLRVVYDRFDLSNEQFVRYTVLLTQRDRFWGGGPIGLEEDFARASEAFRRQVSRLASDEAEIAYLLLSELDGIEVEDVRRCRIGPFLLPGCDSDPRLRKLLDVSDREASPWVLCLPEDRAGKDVASDVSNDPLLPLLRNAVSAPSRELLEQKSRVLGYHVAKSRKFVCPRALVRPLRQLCADMGGAGLIRGV